MPLARRPAAVPTNVPLLDAALGGGVAPGSFVLALGEPASGMELLAKQFAAGAERGRVLAWSPDESEAEWLSVLSRFGSPNVHVVDIASEYFHHAYGVEREGLAGASRGGSRGGHHAETTERATPDFLDAIVQQTAEVRPDRVIVDTLDFFAELYAPTEILRAMRALRIVNRDAGGVLLVTKMKGTSDPNLETMLQHVADVVLDFSVEATAQDFSWRLTLKKVRNEPQKVGSFLYNPTPTGLVRDTRRRV